MIKDIKYGGYTAQPSDYGCQDGELATSLNLINEEGGMTRISQPLELFSIPEQHRIYQHSTALYRHIIAWKASDSTTNFIAFDIDGTEIGQLTDLPDEINSVSSLGNTLILTGKTSLIYILWDPAKSEYRYLGTKPPKPEMIFSLKGDIISTGYSSALKLIDSSSIQSSNSNWIEIASVGYNNLPISESNFGPGVVYPNKSSELQFLPTTTLLEKGKEYRLSFNPAIGNPSIRLYHGTNANQHTKTNCIFETDRHSYSFVADKDYEHLSFCIIHYAHGPHTHIGIADVSGSVILETSSLEHINIPCKLIEYSKDSYDAISAALNKFLNEEGTSKNRFIYPFFVRYAMRLYDGSYVNISSPCLMIPNSSYVPLIFYREAAPQLALRAFCATLCYEIKGSICLSGWEDIVAGLDIFVSNSAWPYNQGKEFDANHDNFSFELFDTDTSPYGILRLVHNGVELTAGQSKKLLLKQEIKELYDTSSYQPTCVALGKRSTKEHIQELISLSNYYKYLSLDYDEIKDSSDIIEPDVPEDTLYALEARSRLDLSSTQYEGFAGASIHAYNNRLHIFDATAILPSPATFSETNPTDLNSRGLTDKVEIAVFLRTQSGSRVVRRIIQDTSPTAYQYKPMWYFYPDARAYRAVFTAYTIDAEIYRTFDIALKPHPFLNGSYAIVASLDESFISQLSDTDPLQDVEDNPVVDTKSSIFVSLPSNPFVFPLVSVCSMGVSRVLSLSSAVKALSQGQFGQFPLYAFTSEGVWALETNSTGTYSARQPITRDVCVNPSSITQIDSAVLFATTRGIMLLSGSQAQCISDAIATDTPFDVLSLPGMDTLHPILGHDDNTCFPIAPFTEFLKTCGMIYDYVHQHIIIFSPQHTYAYVYSLKSHQWGMMFSEIVDAVNSYPEALAVDSNNKLVDFSKRVADNIKGLLITRPLKLEAADVLKTIDTIIQRGNFRKGSVKSVLYGSRDLYKWSLVWSSKDHYLRGFRGTPYKYFRVALLCDLAEGESIYGATVQFETRKTNQPR